METKYKVIDGELYAVKMEKVDKEAFSAEVEAKLASLKKKSEAKATAQATVRSYEAQIEGYDKDIREICDSIDIEAVRAIYPDAASLFEGFRNSLG